MKRNDTTVSIFTPAVLIPAAAVSVLTRGMGYSMPFGFLMTAATICIAYGIAQIVHRQMAARAQRTATGRAEDGR
ncbi:hypothetical protein ACQFYA_21150 [Promicromonospora sp. Marseille-Q5078]